MNLSKKFYAIACLICVLGLGLRIYNYSLQGEKVGVGQNFAKQNSAENIFEIEKEGIGLSQKKWERKVKNKEENFAKQNFPLNKKIKLLPPKNNQIYFGAFPDFGGSEEKVETKIITDFEKTVGKKIAWAYFSQNWWQGMGFPKKEIQKIRQAGAVPFVRFMPRSSEIQNEEDEFRKEKKFSLQNIIDGKFDKELKLWAREAKKDGQPILVDFAVEPNGYWFLWSGINNGGKIKNKYGNPNWPDGPERWRDAYRHIIDIFQAEEVKNITWFFHFDLTGSKEEWNLPKYYYPGDDYIDWIGFSFYGPQSDREDYWDKFSEIWEENHKMAIEISQKKPLAILEIGVSDKNPNGSKADWYRDAFKTILKNSYVKFSAVNFWNENWENEDGSHAWIKINSSVETLKSFRKNISNPRFISQPIFSNFIWKKKDKVENFPPKKTKKTEIKKRIKKEVKSWYKPKPEISWQWQLEGNIKTDFDVDLYDLDLFDTPQSVIDELHKKDKKVICYFNAGAWEPYRDDSSKFPKEVLGKIMEGWEDERWLDIKNYEKFSSLILARLDLAKNKKCDGVEPDNIDGFQNKTGFSLNYTDQLNFNKWLAGEAHKRNLAIALKNDLDQVKDLVNNFDFAINEECFEYNECEKLLPFIKNNKAVLGVEYTLPKSKFCSEAKTMKFSWIKMRSDYLLDGYRSPCE